MQSIVSILSLSLPSLKNVQTLDTTIILVFLGLFSFCLALHSMSRVVLLVTLDRTVSSVSAARTTLQSRPIFCLLRTTVTACISGLLFTGLSETWAET